MPPLGLVGLVYGFVVGIDDTVVTLGSSAGLTLGICLLIQLLGHGVEGLLDLLGGSLDGGNVSALVDFLQPVSATSVTRPLPSEVSLVLPL